MCPCCNVGSMTKIPWRVKGKKNRGQLRKVKAPGYCVWKEQLESRTPDFICVMRGFVTKRRYTSATIFIDHFSDLSYVHMPNHSPWKKISLPNTHFKHTLEITVLSLSIIMLIMAGSLINNFWQPLKKTNKQLVSVLPILIFKIAR